MEVHIGEDPADPVFTIMDLLPHLARKVQGDKKLGEAISGESMNLVIGGMPLDADEGEDKVKLAVLQLLEDQYGVTEHDLISAELEAVPAGPARDVGLDRMLLGGYGQDDRVSSWCAVQGLLQVKDPEVTSLAFLVDKEEIGSDGSTGAKSRYLELWVAGLLAQSGEDASFINVAQTLANSQAISADVNAALHPIIRGARSLERGPSGQGDQPDQVHRQRGQVFGLRRQRGISGLAAPGVGRGRSLLAGRGHGQDRRGRRRHHRQIPGRDRHGGG